MTDKAERNDGDAAREHDTDDGIMELTASLFLRHWREFLSGFFFCMACCLLAGAGCSFEGAALAMFLVWTAVFDFHYGLIFDRLLVVFAAAALFFRLSDGTAAVLLLTGALTGGVPLLVLRVLSRGGIGGGDIKLMAVVGLWLGWRAALLTLLLASWGGGLLAAALLLSGRGKRKDAIPFGPFLSFGAWASFLFGKELLALYEGLFSG